MRSIFLVGFFLLLSSFAPLASLDTISMPCDEQEHSAYDPNTPFQLCSNLPWQFIDCVAEPSDPPPSLSELAPSGQQQPDSGSSKSGQRRGCGPDGTGIVRCRVLNGISCSGPKEFERMDTTGRWCLAERRERHGAKRFATAAMLSVCAGWLGADRMYLGYVGIGILKLLTLGGIGVWWIIDIGLLCIGTLKPADGAEWDDSW